MQVLLGAAALAVLLAVVGPAPVLRRRVQVLLRGEPRRARRREPHLAVVVVSEHHVGVVDTPRHDLTAEVAAVAQVLRLHWSVSHLMSVDRGGPLGAVVSQSIGEIQPHPVRGVVQAARPHLEVAVRSAVPVEVWRKWVLTLQVLSRRVTSFHFGFILPGRLLRLLVSSILMCLLLRRLLWTKLLMRDRCLREIL